MGGCLTAPSSGCWPRRHGGNGRHERGCSPTTTSKTNGVTTTLRAVLRHLPGDIAARIYTADDVGADEPDYLSLRAAGIGIPFYGEMHPLAALRRLPGVARADGLDVIHCTTPGPVGLAARYVSGKLAPPMVGSFHTLLSGTEVLSGSRRLGQAMRVYQRYGAVAALSGAHRRRRACSSTPASGRSAARARGGYSRLHARGAFRSAASGLGRPAAGADRTSAAGCRARRASTLPGDQPVAARPRTAAPPLFIGDPDAAELQAACPGAHRPGRAPGRAGALASADLPWFRAGPTRSATSCSRRRPAACR